MEVHFFNRGLAAGIGPVSRWHERMLFHTFHFLVFFLVVFAVYWALRRHRWRLGWLLLASLYFYASWNPWLISLIVFSASVDYGVALLLQGSASPGKRRLLLLLSVGTNLGLLAFFKYVNFFLDSVYAVQGCLGLQPGGRLLDVVLPLGISFYTFETISYIVDVYLGRIRAVRNLLDYALYILFFPHLVAGPIVRPRDFLPQLGRRKHFNWDRCQLGLQFLLLGLLKKAVLADHLAAVIDPVFAAPSAYSSAAAWLAVLGYAAQIYCDFSGYSDMAVGLAHLLGFRLPANFNLPYLAASPAEFWRRWHISLSSWLRDYLYIPLGGNRGGRLRRSLNLVLTMLLGGLWHGANWTFVAWGLYHGLLLALQRLLPWPKALAGRWFRPWAVAGTFLAVSCGWVFFRARSFADAGSILTRLVRPTAGSGLGQVGGLTVAAIVLLVLVGHVLGGCLPLKKVERRVPAPALGAALAALLVLILLLVPEDAKAFIYFQF
jgi:alginate O-acetyltransferase complex protein AlgI